MNDLAKLLRSVHQYIFARQWRDDDGNALAIVLCDAITKAIWALPDPLDVTAKDAEILALRVEVARLMKLTEGK